MSSGTTYTLELSQEAFDDLVDIQDYTFNSYGEIQLEKYKNILNDALLQITASPFSGYKRPDVPDRYLNWNAGRHVMIYRVEEHTIYLVRVLHQMMDFTYQFH